MRRRWALRWRTEKAVQEIAESLSWEVAGSIGSLIPVDDLGPTIRQAVLDEFATGQQLDRQIAGRTLRVADPADRDDAVFYGIMPSIARMLDWLIRHEPRSAGHIIGEIVGEAERRLGIPREVSEHSLRTALALDSKLDQAARKEFLSRVLTPNP